MALGSEYDADEPQPWAPGAWPSVPREPDPVGVYDSSATDGTVVVSGPPNNTHRQLRGLLPIKVESAEDHG